MFKLERCRKHPSVTNGERIIGGRRIALEFHNIGQNLLQKAAGILLKRQSEDPRQDFTSLTEEGQCMYEIFTRNGEEAPQSAVSGKCGNCNKFVIIRRIQKRGG